MNAIGLSDAASCQKNTNMRRNINRRPVAIMTSSDAWTRLSAMQHNACKPLIQEHLILLAVCYATHFQSCQEIYAAQSVPLLRHVMQFVGISRVWLSKRAKNPRLDLVSTVLQ
jgi:hypothetical protein